MMEEIEKVKEYFGKLLEEQLERVERLKKAEEWIDYAKLKPITIGIIGEDGIGSYITKETQAMPTPRFTKNPPK